MHCPSACCLFFDFFLFCFDRRTNKLCDCSFRRYRGTEQWKEAEEKQKETSVYYRELHEILLKKKNEIYIRSDQYINAYLASRVILNTGIV